MNYKYNRKLTTLSCDYCRISYDKPTSEYQRNTKLGRKSFCSRSCSGKNVTLKRKGNTPSYDISKHNKRDQYSCFRYLFRSCKKRTKDINIDLEYLKFLWEKQKGICPYTNVKLILPDYSNVTIPFTQQASIDRVDSSKGYLIGNIEFIALPINYMKNNRMSKEDTILYLKSITS